MIFTLAWKELREHQGVWLTMFVMTLLLGWGMAKIVALEDPNLAVQIAALTVLGMAATHGVVCGAMMIAGEHEGGTLVFLDIFLGRRGLLWLGKFGVGAVLVVSESVAVGLALGLLQQEAPSWAMALVGQPRARAAPYVWIIILPMVSIEAYAFGLLGSCLTNRVLGAAAIAAIFATPVWLLAIFAPPLVFFTLQIVLALVVLLMSYAIFLSQSQEATLGPPVREALPDSKEQFIDRFERFERDAESYGATPAPVVVTSVPASKDEGGRMKDERDAGSTVIPHPSSFGGKTPPARSPSEALWWLTLQQAWPILWSVAGISLLGGFIVGVNLQVLWPIATLLLGVVCGTAAFAPEQRDLSYQFLSAQHFPLQAIWRFKILFWLAVAVLGALTLLLGHLLTLSLRAGLLGARAPGGFDGTLPNLMGPMLFFGAWLLYGFGAGQVVVWLCRKSILAILVSSLVAGAAIALWLPSLVCGGMGGWQAWAPPLTALLATWCLMRAWCGGRIRERQPVAALIGFTLAVLIWVLVNYGYRAWQVPDVGQPLDLAAFHASLPADKDNGAARAIHQAVNELDGPNDAAWQASMEEAARLPVGVLIIPREEDHSPNLLHLPNCRKISADLLRLARDKEPGPAFEHIAQILALSRNLRNHAPLESYLAGVQIEKDAMNGLDQWLARGKPTPKLLRRVLDELNRHAHETPPALSCVQAECVCSGGMLGNANAWTLRTPGAVNGIPEHWLAGGIVFSLDLPHEAERKMRIWRLVWAGLFRAVETPHWELPASTEDLHTRKDATRKILHAWLPAAAGPGSSISRADVAGLLDASWLADERLFCAVAPLREAATRAQWRVDGTRLAVALSLYRLEQGNPAPALRALVPKYLPMGLPADPYTGQWFHYRSQPGEPAIVWSTGPDRIDHGGRNHGGHLSDHSPAWSRAEFDLITPVPHWP